FFLLKASRIIFLPISLPIIPDVHSFLESSILPSIQIQFILPTSRRFTRRRSETHSLEVTERFRRRRQSGSVPASLRPFALDNILVTAPWQISWQVFMLDSQLQLAYPGALFSKLVSPVG